MPFTPSHAAAVLPLRGRMGLPFAALAAGSMSPDLPYYLPRPGWTPLPDTHTFWGILTWDLIFGLAMWGTWCAVRQPLYDLAPNLIRARWRHPDIGFRGWRLAPVAVLIGSVTHVVWDEFTHEGRFGATHLSILAHSYPSPLGPLAGYQYLQYLSSALGLAVLLCVWGLIPKTNPDTHRYSTLVALTPVVVIGCGTLAAVLVLTQASSDNWRNAGFAALTAAIRWSVIAALALAIGHSVLTRWRSAKVHPD